MQDAHDVDEVLEAEVIDDELMIPKSSFEIDMSEIQRDVDELTGAIDGALTVFGELLVDADAIEAMPYDDVRRFERELSAVVKAADDLRKKLNRDYKVPLDRAKERYDELMGPVIGLHGAYKARRVELDDEAKREKAGAVQAMYEQMAPHIAVPLDGQAEALVPFHRIQSMYGSKWANKGESLASIEKQLAQAVSRIDEGERRLEGERLAHPAEAMAVFWQTLDADAAMARDRELSAAEERQEALEAARAAGAGRLPSPASHEPAPVPPAPVRDGEREPRVMLIDGATDDECRQIGRFCGQLGVTGVFKGPRFYAAAKKLLGEA